MVLEHLKSIIKIMLVVRHIMSPLTAIKSM